MCVKMLLEDEIRSELDALSEMEVGTDKHKTTVEGLVKLIDRSIEMEKVQAEINDKEATRENESSFKERQAKDEQLDRYVRNGITLAGIIIPSVITVWGTLKSFKFEEEGTITTIMGRGFINKLLPKK